MKKLRTYKFFIEMQPGDDIVCVSVYETSHRQAKIKMENLFSRIRATKFIRVLWTADCDDVAMGSVPNLVITKTRNMKQPKKEECIIYYTGEGEFHTPGYLHGPVYHPDVKSEMYAVVQSRVGSKVFKIWEAEKFVSESKNKEFLKIIMLDGESRIGGLVE